MRRNVRSLDALDGSELACLDAHPNFPTTIDLTRLTDFHLECEYNIRKSTVFGYRSPVGPSSLTKTNCSGSELPMPRTNALLRRILHRTCTGKTTLSPT